MQIKDIANYVVPIPLSSFCDIDDCPYPAEYYYRNNTIDTDAFQAWSVCPEHSDQLDKQIAQNREAEADLMPSNSMELDHSENVLTMVEEDK